LCVGRADGGDEGGWPEGRGARYGTPASRRAPERRRRKRGGPGGRALGSAEVFDLRVVYQTKGRTPVETGPSGPPDRGGRSPAPSEPTPLVAAVDAVGP